ncbi:MAG: hypothetical protein K0U98_04400 [Deltaproteobacteria bacterium]|nr:hypothetical protein [Deltaproteobacteria bacterium]
MKHPISNIPRVGLIIAFLGLGSLATSAMAQDGAEAPFSFRSGESSLLSGTPHPALFSDSKVEGYDYLEASVAVEDKAAAVTWAPFLLPRGGNSSYNFWSESRLQLSQKDDVTAVGLSFKYNPLNPVSSNGKAKWQNYWDGVREKSPHGTFPLALTDAKKLRRNRLQRREFDALTYRTDADCPDQRARVKGLQEEVLEARAHPASGDLLYRVHCALVELDTARAELQDEIHQLEFVAEGPDPENLQQKKKTLKVWNKAFPIFLSTAERSYIAEHAALPGLTDLEAIRAEITALGASIDKALASYAAKAYLGYREELYGTRKPVISLNYIHSFFNVISGGEVDNDGDGLNDNDHQTKSRSLSLSLDWRLGEKNGLSFLLSRSTERESSERGAPIADYDGIGATWSRRLTVLNEKGYKKTDDYKESLFVPSIVFGIAFEARDCSSPDEDCAKGILRTQAVTPFVDFKIKKSAQFRIGFPFKRERIFRPGETDLDQDSIDIVSLVAFQLGAPN